MSLRVFTFGMLPFQAELIMLWPSTNFVLATGLHAACHVTCALAVLGTYNMLCACIHVYMKR